MIKMMQKCFRKKRSEFFSVGHIHLICVDRHARTNFYLIGMFQAEKTFLFQSEARQMLAYLNASAENEQSLASDDSFTFHFECEFEARRIIFKARACFGIDLS